MNVAVSVPSPPAPPPEGEGFHVPVFRITDTGLFIVKVAQRLTTLPSPSGGGAGEREVPSEREGASHSPGFATLSPKQTVLLDRFGSISSKQNEALHYLPALPVDRSDRLGFSVDALEACTMAWLTRQVEDQTGAAGHPQLA